MVTLSPAYGLVFVDCEVVVVLLDLEGLTETPGSTMAVQLLKQMAVAVRARLFSVIFMV